MKKNRMKAVKGIVDRPEYEAYRNDSHRDVAGIEDYGVALAAFHAACERWPNTPITLRQGSRVIEDSRKLRLAWSDKGRQGGR